MATGNGDGDGDGDARPIHRVIRFRFSALLFLGASAASSLIDCGGEYGEDSPTPPPSQQAREPGSEGQACFPNGTCLAPLTCLSALCVRQTAASGSDGGDGQGDAGVDGGLDGRKRKHVFVTSDAFLVPALGGLAGADLKCTTIANDAGLGGDWTAFLSGTSENAIDRVGGESAGTAAYETLAGDIVFDSLDAIRTKVPLKVAINVSETKKTLQAGVAVWTGSLPVGTGTSSVCGGWTSTAGQGTIGLVGKLDGAWTQAQLQSCGADGRLYCFEK